MKESNLKILNSFRWILFLGVIPFDKAALTMYRSPSLGDKFSFLLNLIVLIIALLESIIAINNRKFKNKTSSIICIVFLLIIFSSGIVEFMNDNFSIVRLASIVCLWGYYLFAVSYGDYEKLISDINIACCFLIILSFFYYYSGNEHAFYIQNSFVRTFKGVAQNRNSFIEFALFPILANSYKLINEKRFQIVRIITVIVSAYSIILTGSAASAICLIMFIVFIIFKPLLSKAVSLKTFYLLYLILVFELVFLNLNQTDIIQFVLNKFGKSSTLTGRIDIWPISLRCFVEKPLLGYGVDTNILLKNGIIENDPHNGILYLLLTSGLVGLSTFIIIIKKMIDKSQKIICTDNLAYCIMAFINSWMIRGLAESSFSYSHFIFWLEVILMFEIIERKEEKGRCSECV